MGCVEILMTVHEGEWEQIGNTSGEDILVRIFRGENKIQFH